MTTSTQDVAAVPGSVGRRRFLTVVGAVMVVFPLVYLTSDVVEVVQGDFTPFRLTLTYVGEAGFPFLVVGLCAVLGERLRWWGHAGGLAYAYAYVFFTSTVVWALVARTSDWQALGDDFGAWLTWHGAVMVAGGAALGAGVARSDGYVPRWSGVVLVVGVVLVATASGSGNVVRTLAASVPDAAFVVMGWTLLRRVRSRETP